MLYSDPHNFLTDSCIFLLPPAMDFSNPHTHFRHTLILKQIFLGGMGGLKMQGPLYLY